MLDVSAELHMQAVKKKLRDAMVPGFLAEFDPEEAQLAGAFVEDALSEEDALESACDLDLLLDLVVDLVPASEVA